MEIFTHAGLTDEEKKQGYKFEMFLFGYEGEELYISARVAGLEDNVAKLMCGYDDEPYAEYGKYVLVREAWAREQPAGKARIELLDIVREQAPILAAKARKRIEEPKQNEAEHTTNTVSTDC